MIWLPLDTWIVVTGALCAVACALPGCFLVLRQMSMMGDAISHAVLPGLAGGFLMMLLAKDSVWIEQAWPAIGAWLDQADPRHPLVMFGGAVVIGILTTVFTQWISTFGRVDRGAAMGIVFTTLFALGLILIVRATADHRVDLDAECVLYGAIEYTPLDTAFTMNLAGRSLAVPRAAAVLGVALLVNLAIIVAMFKEFRIAAFDPELATTLGIHAQFMHYLLMTMTAVTTVASFEAVGSIIVIAMLIVPAATAYLLTDRLGVMVLLSSIVGVLAAALGHLGAITIPTWFGYEDTSTAGMMAGAAGGLFVLAWLLAPRHGVLARRLYQGRVGAAEEPGPVAVD